ncbi:hypothetical protein B1sIIB91_04795 [Candidatus Nanopelagicus abundans]|uniref:Uncharacterized protein n=1 Tax=Candidatus Nanopelagicus abundans TaxID=1884916 RepID=A0A249L537_9ACTN|nr:hypothetical protein B1sIIB91_04795 [Candidatus Nanopelagicus abundans]
MKLRSVFATENSRVRAIYLLRLESLIILGLVIYLLVAPLISKVNAPAALSAEIIFGLLASIGLWASASGFKQKKSFGRAPAVLANLIALGVSYYMITGKLLIVGIPLAILAAITLISSALGYRE